MNNLFVYIDYHEDAAPEQAYERIRIADLDGTLVKDFATGDPVADWATAMAYLKEQGRPFYYMTSSVDHFVFDVPGYRFIERSDGLELLVRESLQAEQQ